MLLNSMTDIDKIEEYEGCDDGSNGNGGAGFRPLGEKKKRKFQAHVWNCCHKKSN